MPRDRCRARDTGNGDHCRGQIVGGGLGVGTARCLLAAVHTQPASASSPPGPFLRRPSLLEVRALERCQSLDRVLCLKPSLNFTQNSVSFHFCCFSLFFLIVHIFKSVLKHLFCLCRGSHGSLVDPGFLETL